MGSIYTILSSLHSTHPHYLQRKQLILFQNLHLDTKQGLKLLLPGQQNSSIIATDLA